MTKATKSVAINVSSDKHEASVKLLDLTITGIDVIIQYDDGTCEGFDDVIEATGGNSEKIITCVMVMTKRSRGYLAYWPEDKQPV